MVFAVGLGAAIIWVAVIIVVGGLLVTALGFWGMKRQVKEMENFGRMGMDFTDKFFKGK